MNKKNIFCTINTFQTLPPFYQLINCLFSNEKENNLLIHNTVNGFEKRSTMKNLEEISIIRFRSLFHFQNQSIFHKIWKYFRLFKLFVLNVIIKKNDVRIFTFDIFTTVIAVLFKKKNKIIYLQYEMIDESQLNRFDKFLFKRMIKLVDKIDLIITPEENRTDYLMSQLKSKQKAKFFTLPNSNNNEFEIGIQQNSNELKPIIVTHIGAVGLNHNIKEFLNVISKLNQEKYEFRFVGLIHQSVKNQIQNYKLKNVKLVGQVPHEQLKKLYLETDIGIILYKDVGLNYRFCAPNKLYEYWSYGVHVIGDLLPSLKSVFKHECLGILVDMSDHDAFSNAIFDLGNKKNKNEVQAYFNQNYRLDVFSNSLKIRLEQL
jgi:glycosyltransferase involved in cell wall biosynthesis